MKKIILGAHFLVALMAAFQLQAVGRNGAGVNPNAGQSGMLGTTTDSRPPVSGSNIVLGGDSASRPPVGSKLGMTPDSRPLPSGLMVKQRLSAQDMDSECEGLIRSGSKIACPRRPIRDAARTTLGGNSSTWTPSKIQLEALRVNREISQTAEFMPELAQSLANLKKDNPQIFKKYFEDRFNSRADLTGTNPSSWGPAFWNLSKLQQKVYVLKSEFFKAQRFMEDVALKLGSLRKDHPEIFEQYFGDSHSNASMSTVALASDVEPSLQIAK